MAQPAHPLQAIPRDETATATRAAVATGPRRRAGTRGSGAGDNSTLPLRAAITALIERGLGDPGTDPDKLQHLIELQVRLDDRAAAVAFAIALARMQPDLPIIAERGRVRDRQGKVQSTYALWEDSNELIRPILSRHGFALSFRTGQEGQNVLVTGVLSHRQGHAEQSTLRLPLDTSGGKTPVQAIGSSTSYGKRYVAAALLNLTSRGEDDDGQDGPPPQLITPEQVDELEGMIHRTRADRSKLLAYLKVKDLTDLSPASYGLALRVLAQKGAQP